MSGKGWRRPKGEPLDDLVPEVKSSVGRLSLELLEQRGVVRSWQLQTELPMPTEAYTTAFGVDRDRFVAPDSENVLEFVLDLAPPNNMPDGSKAQA